MSKLSDFLGQFKNSQEVAEWCDANGFPVSALFCRLMLDRPPFAPNMMRMWAANNATITAQTFADLDSFFSNNPIIRDTLLANVQTHAPHLWAKPLNSYVDTPRTELGNTPLFQSGGFLNRIMLRDEVNRQCSIEQLINWMKPYKDSYPWIVNIDDCDDKADRISGYSSRCPHPRPSIGDITITGTKNNIPQGHTLKFSICTDGIAMIENDGSVYKLDTENKSFNDWSNVAVMYGDI